MDRKTFLDKVIERYEGCYDINRMGENGDGLVAVCEYHEHDVGYALVRKAEMWSADRHEYVWFYSVPHLSVQLYDTYYEEAFKAGMERVNPDKGHMSSAVVVVIIADTADADALEKLKKTRFRKDFKFGLNGWMAVRTAGIVLSDETVVTNGEGRNEKKFFNSILHPVKNKARRRSLNLFKEILK